MQLDPIAVRVGAVAFVLLAPVVAPLPANAALVTPAGLSVGQGYRLAFVTLDGINATSSNIATYNAFATTQASQNAELAGLSWTAIASTATTNAVDNVACAGCNDVPIYMVDGTKLAASTVALFSQQLLSEFFKNQYGKTNPDSALYYAWTGSSTSGMKSSNPLGSARPETGYPLSRFYWLNGGAAFFQPTDLYSVYAISSEVFVGGAPTSVPEPATIALLGAGGLLALGARRRAGRAPAA